MGRQESDGRVVPEGHRKVSRADESRQGKATTDRKQAVQLELFTETADRPKSVEGESDDLPPMTLKEIANGALAPMP